MSREDWSSRERAGERERERDRDREIENYVPNLSFGHKIDVSAILAVQALPSSLSLTVGKSVSVSKPLLYADVVKRQAANPSLANRNLAGKTGAGTPGKRKISTTSATGVDSTDRKMKIARHQEEEEEAEVLKKKNKKMTKKEMKELLVNLQKEKNSSTRMMSFLQQQIFGK
jgi:hypothetical protein